MQISPLWEDLILLQTARGLGLEMSAEQVIRHMRVHRQRLAEDSAYAREYEARSRQWIETWFSAHDQEEE